MAQTKEEIESSIRELQYQYEALIAEGSYKLADQRLKRIKELKEQLKHMKDSMEILRLSGFQVNDACTKDYNFEDPKVIEAVIKKLEKEAKEGKFVDPNYLAGVKRALEKAKKERAKDACTKDITVKQYVKKLREESGSPISHESLARELKKAGWSKEEALQEVLREAVERVYGKDACEKVFTKGEAEDDDIILPQHKCSDSIESEIARLKQKIEGLYDKADEALKAKDKNKYNIIMSQIKQEERTLADLVRSTIHDDDATENGSIEEFGKNKEIEKMSPEKDPTLAQDASYPVVHRDGDFKIVESDEGFELYFKGIYYDTYHTKEQALKFIEKYKERAKARGIKDAAWRVESTQGTVDLKIYTYKEGNYKISVGQDEPGEWGWTVYQGSGVWDTGWARSLASAQSQALAALSEAKRRSAKDSDPKVAEANAIINLCGGVM